MANMLDYLLGRPQTASQLPVRYEDGLPSLTAHNAAPSENFSAWLTELLGGGPKASLAHQRFAEGVPSLLQATPLGIGLSAADLIHAKRADDPMGAAAAAIGMIPGAGPAGRKAAKPAADQTMKWIEEGLAPYLPPINPAKKYYESEDATAKALKAIEEILGPAKVPAAGNAAIPHGYEPMDHSISWLHPADTAFQNGQWVQKAGTPNTKATLAAAQTETPIANAKAAAQPDWLHEPNGVGSYDIYNANTGKTHATASTPAEAATLIKQYKETGVYPKPAPTTTQKMDQASAKPVFDYEKDDNGLYHVFNAVTGQKHAVVDTQSQAMAWINEQKAAAMGLKYETNPFKVVKNDYGNYNIFHGATGEIHGVEYTKADAEEAAKAFWNPTGGKKNIPITQGTESMPSKMDYQFGPQVPARPPWMKPDLVKEEADREAARLAGGYTTPAYRGIRVTEGQDFNPVHHGYNSPYLGESHYSSASPQLADMYAGYHSKWPGEFPKEGVFPEGSSGVPLWLNTNDYHVADAKGAKWTEFNAKAMAEAKEQGKPGVVIHNVWDEPNSTKNLSSPQTIYITFPTGVPTIKSKFAAMFDPKSPDISRALVGGAGLGAAGYAMQTGDAQAARAQQPQMQQTKLQDTIDSIMQTFNYQDNMMRYMRLPLANAAERRRTP